MAARALLCPVHAMHANVRAALPLPAGTCLCQAGGFSPCLPSDTVCSWGQQPICVSSPQFFGVPACTFVGLLQRHLPRAQCPY